MVDYLTEIPLPGRTFAASAIGATDRNSAVALPAFVAGPENRLVAHTVGRLSDAAAPSNGAPHFAPSVLALFGASGVGKTHLARGLVRYWKQQRGDESAQYATAGDFRREFTEAIRREAVVDFRQKFRDHQLLAIDDLHHLPNDRYLLQELRYTLDDYDERGATVVVTSSRPPSRLANISDDLRSRLAAGLLIQAAAPGSDARLRIIRQAATAIGRALSDHSAHRLAAGLTGTAADLFGALFELIAAPAGHETSDLELAERLLASRAARRPTLRQIVATVAKHSGLPRKELKSSSRKQPAVFARAIVAYLAREHAGASYEQIGRALGGRDHTTIMHNYRKIDSDRQRDPATQETLDELRRILLC